MKIRLSKKEVGGEQNKLEKQRKSEMGKHFVERVEGCDQTPHGVGSVEKLASNTKQA